jgi:hypothetical protein
VVDDKEQRICSTEKSGSSAYTGSFGIQADFWTSRYIAGHGLALGYCGLAFTVCSRTIDQAIFLMQKRDGIRSINRLRSDAMQMPVTRSGP